MKKSRSVEIPDVSFTSQRDMIREIIYNTKIPLSAKQVSEMTKIPIQNTRVALNVLAHSEIRSFFCPHCNTTKVYRP